MKKSSKVLSIILAALMALSSLTCLTVLNASAAEDSTKFYFELPVDLWGFKDAQGNSLQGDSTTSVFCHIWAIDNDPDFAGGSWQAKSEKCSYDADLGLYYYDISAKLKQTLKPDADYGIIFSAKSNKAPDAATQTYNTTMGASCYGDTAYVIDKKYENPEDSSQLAWGAFWKSDANKNVYGPQMAITSTGNVTGEFWAPHQSASNAVAEFINGKSLNIQNIIDTEGRYCCVDICKTLKTTPEDVYNAYKTLYASQLAADPVTIPTLETVATFLQYTPTTTTAPVTEPVTTEPVTEPVTTEPVTEPVTTEPVTEPVTTEPVTEPVTTEPVTEPVTTEPVTEPVTTEPVTEPVTTEPATEPVTTEPATEPTTAPVTTKTFTVAGDEGLCDGVTWDPTQNAMTNGSYTFDNVYYDYSITFADVAKGSHSFKITDGTWDNAWGKDGENYAINLSDNCDVTIYFNSKTFAIDVDAANLTDFTLESISLAGNGDGNWLNGANWDPTDTSNDLTEVEPGVWSITYEDIDAFDGYAFKFLCNHSWTVNWSSTGIFNMGDPQPMNVVDYDHSNVTITIDVNGFDFNTMSGTVKTTFDVSSPKNAYIIGDADGDGVISVNDATFTQKYIMHYITEGVTDLQLLAMDANEDGIIDINDVTLMQKALVADMYDIGNVGKPALAAE